MSGKYPGGFVTASAPAGYSVAFDGTGDYLSLANNAALQLTGNFTIEFWVYSTSFAANQRIIVKGNSSANDYSIDLNTTGTFSFNNSTIINTSTSSILVNTWNHVALTRSGSTCTWWINGVSSNTFTTSQSFNNTNALWLGLNQTSLNLGLFGYLSNVRIINGTALYTAAFTPPTQLFPVTNTQLLTCQSPTIIDNSNNAFTVTANGDAIVSNFTPFAAYIPAPTGFNPALGAAAPGVWTLSQAEYYTANRLWPIYDPYFSYTTLMLHGNGTNAAQNNTFIDSSTNNFTVTRNGNTTQGSFTPFSPTGWSLSVTSGADNANYITTAGSANLSVNRAFTIEFWLWIDSYAITNTRIFDTGGNGSSAAMTIGYGDNGSLGFGPPAGGVTGVDAPAGTVRLGVWQHIVCTCTAAGANGAIYVNGVLKAGPVAFSASTAASPAFRIANNNVNAPDYAALIGYISNFRFVSGQALYTSNFIPDVRPLTSTTYTVDGGATYQTITGTCQLLTCQNNRFVDNSANNFALTVNGSNATTQAFSPFNPTTAYSQSVIGGSAYFDGTGDYLNLASNAAFAFGTNSFTWETWFYSTGAVARDACFYDLGAANTTGGFAVFTTGSTLYVRINGTGQDLTYTLTTTWINVWHHLAVVRNGTTLTIYLDGVNVASGTRAQDVTQNTPYIGNSVGVLSAYPFLGYLSGMRVVNGTALYTANFTPPTAPPNITSNATQLLLNFTNAGIFDNTAKTIWETVGDAKISTAQSKYGSSSMAFDGTGDYLLPAQTAATQLALGTADFTIEMWVYTTTTAAAQILIDFRPLGTDGLYPMIFIASGGGSVRYNVSAADRITGTTTIATGTWYHIAVCRVSSQTRMFVNGTQVGSTYADTNSYLVGTTRPIIGAGGNTFAATPLNGYINDLRVTKGVGRYTTTFTPPTSQLQDQ